MFKRPEPTLIINFVMSLVVLAGTFGWDKFSSTQAGLVTAAIVAVTAAINALTVKPVAVPLFAGAVTAVVAVLAGWGLKVAPETTGAITFVLLNALAFLGTRDQATPNSDPVVGGGVTKANVPEARVPGGLSATTG